jgi:hypothetical protein
VGREGAENTIGDFGFFVHRGCMHHGTCTPARTAAHHTQDAPRFPRHRRLE